jgi:hypothetical protein
MRNRISLVLVAVLVAGAAFVTQAGAQYTEPVGLTARAGAFFPTDEATKNASEDVWFTAGLEYKIGDLGVPDYETGYRSYWSVSGDYYGQGDFTAIPVLVNYVGQVEQFHYSLGAGVTFAELPGLDNQTVFGYRIAVGFEFNTGTTPFFVEGGFFGASGEDVEEFLNGFFGVVGVRF